MINGQHLIRWGYKPGHWFHHAIMEAEKERQAGASEEEIRRLVAKLAPKDVELDPPTKSDDS
jgi:hypothetical protein